MKQKTKYQNICDELRGQIVNGVLQGKMPSMRELTDHYQVSHVTILRVFRELAGEGLIKNREKSSYVICNRKITTRNLVVCLSRSLWSINEENNLINEIRIGVEKTAQEKRLSYLVPSQNSLINYQDTPDTFFEEIIWELESYLPRTCGVLLHASFTDAQLERYFLPKFGNIPAVIVGRKTELPLHSVEMPTEAGCREAAKLASKAAYSDYILCQAVINTDYQDCHVDIFAGELKKNGCDESRIHYCRGVFTSPSVDAQIIENLRAAIAGSQGKPLIFASSGRSAHWICQDLKPFGFEAGRDYGLLAFDGKGFCANNEPKIASVKIDGEEMGRLAVASLIGGDYRQLRQVVGFRIDINETL